MKNSVPLKIHFKKGQSLLEAVVASGLIGLVAILSSMVYTSFNSASQLIFQELGVATAANNFAQFSLQPEMIENLLLAQDKNPSLRNCLKFGQCPSTETSLDLEGGVDWPFSGEKVALSFQYLGQDLIELRLKFPESKNKYPTTAWISRYDYLSHGTPPGTLRCPIHQSIVGIDYSGLQPICREATVVKHP